MPIVLINEPVQKQHGGRCEFWHKFELLHSQLPHGVSQHRKGEIRLNHLSHTQLVPMGIKLVSSGYPFPSTLARAAASMTSSPRRGAWKLPGLLISLSLLSLPNTKLLMKDPYTFGA